MGFAIRRALKKKLQVFTGLSRRKHLVRRTKNETVSVSFHYLIREKKLDDGKREQIRFSKKEFSQIYERLVEVKNLDTEEEATSNKIRNRSLAPIKSVEKFDDRYIAGIYEGSYWGHSFDNNKKGKIPADSISFRPFFFLLYFSESGRIYVASQYLGSYGAYGAICSTIMSGLDKRSEVRSVSFSLDKVGLENATPKELVVNFSTRKRSLTGRNNFGTKGMVVFRRDPEDKVFGREVSSKLLSKVHQNPKVVRQAIKALANSNDLMEFDDEDIQDCQVLVTIDGRDRTIHFFDSGLHASKIPIEIAVDVEGHPPYEPLKSEVISLLRDEIIARKEDV